MTKLKKILTILYFLFGIYLTNIFFQFITKPQIFTKSNNLIIGLGGVLLLIAGLKSLFIYNTKMPKIKNLK